MDAEGGSRRRLTSDPPTEAVPSWSRDGRWLNFGSRRGSGWDVHKVAVAGGPSSLVTRDGGSLLLSQSMENFCTTPRADRVRDLAGSDGGRRRS
jgi:Tol biopolymer transport system component